MSSTTIRTLGPWTSAMVFKVSFRNNIKFDLLCSCNSMHTVPLYFLVDTSCTVSEIS